MKIKATPIIVFALTALVVGCAMQTVGATQQKAETKVAIKGLKDFDRNSRVITRYTEDLFNGDVKRNLALDCINTMNLIVMANYSVTMDANFPDKQIKDILKDDMNNVMSSIEIVKKDIEEDRMNDFVQDNDALNKSLKTYESDMVKVTPID